MATAPIDMALATEAAEAILKRITEEAPRVSYSALGGLADAYAKVMESARSDQPTRPRSGVVL